MSQVDNPYASFGGDVAAQFAPAADRATFLRKTYIHLAAAVYGLAAIEFALFKLGFAESILGWMQGSRASLMIVFGAFIGVSFLADSWARSSASRGMQYAGLFLYVFAQAIILLPMIAMALVMEANKDIYILGPAIVTTLIIFGGLTAAVLITGADFSFLRTGLILVGFGAMGLIVCSYFFGFDLGTVFTVAMIVFAGAYILYDTSNVLHHYRPEQYVAAALALFASVALLFFYILRLFMDRR